MPLAMPIALLFSLVFGVLVWLLPAFKVLVVLVGIAGVVTIIRHPLWGLLLFTVLATFLPYSTVQIGLRTTVSEALVLLVWGSVLVQGVFNNLPAKPPLLRTERWLVALMLFSAFPFVIGQLTVNADGNGPVNWIRWLLNLSVLFLVPRLLDTPKAREQAVTGLLLGTLMLLLLSIPVFLKNGTATSMTPILANLGYGGIEVLGDSLNALSNRMGSPWMHPNVTGGAMALLLPLAFCFGLTRQGWPRALGFAVAGLGVIALLLTGSRGALLSLIVVLMWMARKRVPYTGRLLMAGVAFGALLLMFYPPLQDRLLTIFSTNDASTSVRFDEYSHFPEAMAMFPFGIGFKVEPPVPGTGLWGISNLWLNFVYKLGVPGLLLFVAVIWSWWRETRPSQRIIRLSADNALWLGTTSGLMAALLSGIFDHYFSFTQVLIALFWLLLGVNLHEARRLKLKAASLSGVRP
ncbi:O-antigen ligase family protein [Pseudomonas gingeri]|uniref:O-antigen ligase family protein n=1 Tax=Pseudomonas gingeri TaxID=117681 RepID=A0A7Y7YCU8_9PSED|nr:O-antigen ligase family protein [Pseudomonas gingeri]NWA03832.1 O-antigen ligase family protein [Pseudomonas gingeri]NWA12764.1 O-antigen ligase family protein [Pseudomonas gingeri]NWA58819.1 O-antigen ligase family protein [Pseudomonas gingeri]NWA94415.1 O-antigen ligase family protein [Pseudomonas gingeri]NWB01071.1 O-antigen ligase family protein [Pseudomonas gingeri]